MDFKEAMKNVDFNRQLSSNELKQLSESALNEAIAGNISKGEAEDILQKLMLMAPTEEWRAKLNEMVFEVKKKGKVLEKASAEKMAAGMKELGYSQDDINKLLG
jgi:hypothetical protein